MKFVASIILAVSSLFGAAHAQGWRPPPYGQEDLERRIGNLERQMSDIQWRLERIERGGIPTQPKGYYCIAQCKGQSSTAAGGSGKSESEAKQAAFDAVRKNWTCHLEIVECSQEN